MERKDTYTIFKITNKANGRHIVDMAKVKAQEVLERFRTHPRMNFIKTESASKRDEFICDIVYTEYMTEKEAKTMLDNVSGKSEDNPPEFDWSSYIC